MGKRTVHQKDAKAQLIAQVHRSGEVNEIHTSPQSHGRCLQVPLEAMLRENREETGLDVTVTEDDVLMKPVWDGDVSMPHLSLLEQCLALARSDLLELGTAKDALQSWEMEPFAQLIQCQASSTFVIQVRTHCSFLHKNTRGYLFRSKRA